MKKPLAIVIGVTTDMAFAAGALMIQLTRHLPKNSYEVLILTTGFSFNDRRILESIAPCRLLPAEEPQQWVTHETLARYSLITLAKTKLFDFLQEFRTVLWLDADMAVQGDFLSRVEDDLAGRPLGMAIEDPSFRPEGPHTAAVNFDEPIPGYDLNGPLLNSGFIALKDTLSDPKGKQAFVVDAMQSFGTISRFSEQGPFNLLALAHKDDFAALPWETYNCHPFNPKSIRAPLVHAFGPCKFWNNGLLMILFPEWLRAYENWLQLGGSAFSGTIVTREFFEHGGFTMLSKTLNALKHARHKIAALEQNLRDLQSQKGEV